MSAESARDYTSLTIQGSETLLRADNRAAIMLLTKEVGPIAFEVNQQAIDALRLQLSRAETHIRQEAGKA
jgi:hypothetical protein